MTNAVSQKDLRDMERRISDQNTEIRGDIATLDATFSGVATQVEINKEEIGEIRNENRFINAVQTGAAVVFGFIFKQ